MKLLEILNVCVVLNIGIVIIITFEDNVNLYTKEVPVLKMKW